MRLIRTEPSGPCLISTPTHAAGRCSDSKAGTPHAMVFEVTETNKKTPDKAGVFSYMAVGQGFEPREPLGSTVFKTAAFDHSASPPKIVPRVPSADSAHYIAAFCLIKFPIYRSLHRSSCAGTSGVVASSWHVLVHNRYCRRLRPREELSLLSNNLRLNNRLRRDAGVIHCTP